MKRIILADDHSFVRLGLVQILTDEYPTVEIKQVSDGESLVKEVTLSELGFGNIRPGYAWQKWAGSFTTNKIDST